MPVADRRSKALRRAALAAALSGAVAAPAAGLPIRGDAGLAVSCQLQGRPLADRDALCAQVVELARRGAPLAVGEPPAPGRPLLHVIATIEGRTRADATVGFEAWIERAGQPPVRARRAAPSIRLNDERAVRAGIDAALASVLPWRAKRNAQVPSPPRAN
jgi:hypothetical protein